MPTTEQIAGARQLVHGRLIAFERVEALMPKVRDTVLNLWSLGFNVMSIEDVQGSLGLVLNNQEVECLKRRLEKAGAVIKSGGLILFGQEFDANKLLEPLSSDETPEEKGLNEGK